MERIFLRVLCFSGWHISTCLPRQYHYVAENKTWTEAQTYCRQTYTDLATIENTEELNQLINTLSSAGHSSEVWIGLYSEIDWRWSDGFTGSGADYRNWTLGQPHIPSSDGLCGLIGTSRESWEVHYCSHPHPFFCYNGTQLHPEFVVLTGRKNWSEAQKYCRENFIDLATVRNDTENQQLLSKAVSGDWTWIGLFSDLHMNWSDGSNSAFRYWVTPVASFGSAGAVCGVAFSQSSGGWRLIPCERKFPFVCYSIQRPETAKRQIVKLKVKLQDSSVNVNDPAEREAVLKKLQDKLKEKGVSGVTVKWREQPDGKVFHKEKKNQKTEL